MNLESSKTEFKKLKLFILLLKTNSVCHLWFHPTKLGFPRFKRSLFSLPSSNLNYACTAATLQESNVRTNQNQNRFAHQVILLAFICCVRWMYLDLSFFLQNLIVPCNFGLQKRRLLFLLPPRLTKFTTSLIVALVASETSTITQLESCLQQLEEYRMPIPNGNSPPSYEVIFQLITLYFMLLCLHSISYFDWGLVRFFPNDFRFCLVYSRFGLFCWQIIWGQTRTSKVKYSQWFLGWTL